MHAEVRILLDAVIETVWPPRIREEHERDRLPEVVQLQAACAHRVHDRGIVDHARRDLECARTEDDVGVRRGAAEPRHQGYAAAVMGQAYPYGSPTTSKETSSVSALARISSLWVSTMSRSATISSFP